MTYYFAEIVLFTDGVCYLCFCLFSAHDSSGRQRCLMNLNSCQYLPVL